MSLFLDLYAILCLNHVICKFALKMKKVFKSILIVFVLVAFVGQMDVIAQCPMCRMSAESNLQNGGSEGAGLNKGILYLFMMPYLLVGTLAFLWWRNRMSEEEMGEV